MLLETIKDIIEIGKNNLLFAGLGAGLSLLPLFVILILEIIMKLG